MTQELITLQFGPVASFIGAHFWNLQEASFRYETASQLQQQQQQQQQLLRSEEADHDALFRVGEDNRGRTTYTPRLVVCDRWSTVPVPIVNVDCLDGDESGEAVDSSGGRIDPLALANAAVSVASRGLPVELHRQANADAAAGRHAFQRQAFSSAGTEAAAASDSFGSYPESSFRVWNDCLGTRLHPRSLLQLSNLTEYSGEVQEDFESRLRLFAEESDCLQGFQILADAHDHLFGDSLAVASLAHLAEEFPKKARLLLPCFPEPAWLPQASASATFAQSYRLQSLLSLVRTDPIAGFTVALASPSSPTPSLWRRAESSSTSMSLCAAAAASAVWLDTMSLPIRLRSSGFGERPDLGDIQRLLCLANRKLCSPSVRLYHDFQLVLSSGGSGQLPMPLGPFLPDVTDGGVGSVACLSVARSLPSRQPHLEAAAALERWLAEVRAPGSGHLASHFHLASPAVTVKPPFPASLLPAGCSPDSRLEHLGAWALVDNSSGASVGMDLLADSVASDRHRCVGGGGGAGATALESDELIEAISAARDIADRYKPDRPM